RWDAVPAEVEEEANRLEAGPDRPESPLATALGESLLKRQTEWQRLDTQLAELAGQDEDARKELERLAADLEGLRPLVEAKRGHRWWTSAWWRATVQGRRTTAAADLEARREQLQADLAECERQATGLKALRQEADAVYQAERTRQVE